MFQAITQDPGEITNFLMNCHKLFIDGRTNGRLKIFATNGDKFEAFRFSIFFLSRIEWQNGAGFFRYDPDTKILYFQGNSRRAFTAENAVIKPVVSKWIIGAFVKGGNDEQENN